MRKYVFIVLTLFYLSVLSKLNAEVFSSISKIEPLLTTQRNIIDTVNNFIKSKNNRNKILKNHVRRFELEHKEAIMDIPRYLGNPVNCFRLIKRLTVDLKLIETVLTETSGYKKNKSVSYPSRDDLMGATEGLLNLELIYGLNKTNMAAGFWNTSYGQNKTAFIETFNPMTISDCYELGKACIKLKYFEDGIGWLMEARKKCSTERLLYPEDNVNLEDISGEMNKAYTEHEREIFNYRNWLREVSVHVHDFKSIKSDLLFNSYRNGLKPSEAIKSIEAYKRNVASQPIMNKAHIHHNKTYTALCKGENNREKVYKNMNCYLAHGPHPFLKLAPMKAERLHRAPKILLFHEVISDKEVEALKAHALAKLKRTPVSSTEGKLHHAYLRSCQGALITSNESLAARIISRIEQFSGLRMTTSEGIQVINYGIGGLCGFHHDYYSDPHTERTGKRIATAQVYMSDVEQGGATVFPSLDIAVFPVKGAALYSVNIVSSGQGDLSTSYAACPVLRGSKWVLIQRIDLHGHQLKNARIHK